MPYSGIFKEQYNITYITEKQVRRLRHRRHLINTNNGRLQKMGQSPPRLLAEQYVVKDM